MPHSRLSRRIVKRHVLLRAPHDGVGGSDAWSRGRDSAGADHPDGESPEWLSRLAGKVLAADVAIMVTGTALGQAASIVLAPVLTRLRTPDPFGSLSVNMAGLTIFVLIG